MPSSRLVLPLLRRRVSSYPPHDPHQTDRSDRSSGLPTLRREKTRSGKRYDVATVVFGATVLAAGATFALTTHWRQVSRSDDRGGVIGGGEVGSVRVGGVGGLSRHLPGGAERARPRSTIFSYDYSHRSECSVYLAPSSVPDASNRPAGFGIYTTRPLSRGDYIFPMGEGPSVAITDVAVNQGRVGAPVPEWRQYVFLYPCVGFNTETDDPSRLKYSSLESNVNLGALGNFHPYLLSAGFDDIDYYDDGLLDRNVDVGAGGFSYHMGKKWHAMRDVEAGEEIFIDYGEEWFLQHELKDTKKTIPRRADYIESAAELEKLSLDFSATNLTKRGDKELFETLVHKMGKKNVRVAKLLEHWSGQELWDLITSDGTQTRHDYATALAKRTIFHRDVKWIKENGRCLDNIIPGVSTIPQAGRGAFASRLLRSGEVVTPVPTLLQVTDKETLNVYRHIKDGEKYQSVGEPISKQLILNYCFGHSRSSMVLCPATSANLINHCSSRINAAGECGSKGPNAKIKWATEFDPETKEWLQRSLQEIAERVKNGRRGLSFEIVATRDIEEGEEIFIDYGENWESAWEHHITNWKPPKNNGFVPIAVMNENITSYLRTVEEIEANPYPGDALLGCFFGGFYHPCEVISRTDHTEPDIDSVPLRRLPVYNVRIHEWQGSGVWEFKYKWIYQEDHITLPLSVKFMRFFHGMYSSDQHLGGMFRQHIGVEDDLWPEQWKDL